MALCATLSNFVVRRYLKRVRDDLVAARPATPHRGRVAAFIESRWPRAAVGRKNLEYWLSGSAYSRDARALGHLDVLTALGRGSARRVVIRGWVCSLAGALKGLTIDLNGVRCSTVIFPLLREDVQSAFAGEECALRSGFMAIASLPEAEGRSVKVTAGWRDASGRESQFVWDAQPVITGVFPFGVPPAASNELDAVAEDTDLLVLVDGEWERAMREALSGLVWSATVLVLPPEATGTLPAESRAGVLGCAATHVARSEVNQRILLACRPSDDLLRLLLPTLVSLPQRMPLRWIVQEECRAGLPRYLQRSAALTTVTGGSEEPLSVLFGRCLREGWG